jgi:hypothetical protein
MRESILGSGHASNVHEPSGNMNTAQPFANTKSSRQPAIHIPDIDAPPTLKDDMKEPRPAKVEKRSMEYLLKSGLAGGLAGCAVCFRYLFSITPNVNTYIRLGKDNSRSTRPRKDSLSNQQSQLREIHWIMDRSPHCNAGYLCFLWCPRPLQGPLRDPPSHLPICWYQVSRI